MQYLLLFHCTNAPHCYVIRTYIVCLTARWRHVHTVWSQHLCRISKWVQQLAWQTILLITEEMFFRQSCRKETVATMFSTLVPVRSPRSHTASTWSWHEGTLHSNNTRRGSRKSEDGTGGMLRNWRSSLSRWEQQVKKGITQSEDKRWTEV
jgi:hypothetical protein